MDKRKYLFLLAVLGLSAWTATAQTSGIAGLWRRLCEPNPKLDSVRIFQPYKGWGVGLVYEMGDNEVKIDTHEEIFSDPVHAVFDYQMKMDTRLTHSLGANVAFGPLQLGFQREVGSGAGKNKAFSFRSDPREYSYESGNRYLMSQSGIYSSWTVRFQLNYRF